MILRNYSILNLESRYLVVAIIYFQSKTLISLVNVRSGLERQAFNLTIC